MHFNPFDKNLALKTATIVGKQADNAHSVGNAKFVSVTAKPTRSVSITGDSIDARTVLVLMGRCYLTRKEYLSDEPHANAMKL